ncbi:hypothetical protein HanIR_Chr17g0857231 [Helianthus annuus]|nr:hypothetical protein HanIR_Chr17g0857231 [Helianthus annuus]
MFKPYDTKRFRNLYAYFWVHVLLLVRLCRNVLELKTCYFCWNGFYVKWVVGERCMLC